MAITVRALTVATTVQDAEQRYPGGLAALMARHAGAVRVGKLVRLPAPVPGVRCGTWAGCPGAYFAELVPHPDIALHGGRHRKVGALVHRAARLRDTPKPPPPPPPLPPAPPPRRWAADLHKRHASIAAAPFGVRGDDGAARALRIALWLCLRKGIPLDELRDQHIMLLPAERFDVDATAVAWEMTFRFGAMASGTANSVEGIKARVLEEIVERLRRTRLDVFFGAYRWPSERRDGTDASPVARQATENRS